MRESWQLLVKPRETRFKAEGRGQKAEVRRNKEVKFADFCLFILVFNFIFRVLPFFDVLAANGVLSAFGEVILAISGACAYDDKRSIAVGIATTKI